jgi:hypothetical protein
MLGPREFLNALISIKAQAAPSAQSSACHSLSSVVPISGRERSMKRRKFISLLGGAAVAWPLTARAQQPELRRVGVLTAYSESDPEAQARVGAFREGLQKLGWTEGRNTESTRAGRRPTRR